MSISVLVNTLGSEGDEASLKIFLQSLEDIAKKHKLIFNKRLAKNIPANLAPVLFCYSHDGKKMLLILFDAITMLGEKRLNIPRII